MVAQSTQSTPVCLASHGGLSAATICQGVMGCDGIVRGRIADVDLFAAWDYVHPETGHAVYQVGKNTTMFTEGVRADVALTEKAARRLRCQELAAAYELCEADEACPFALGIV